MGKTHRCRKTFEKENLNGLANMLANQKKRKAKLVKDQREKEKDYRLFWQEVWHVLGV